MHDDAMVRAGTLLDAGNEIPESLNLKSYEIINNFLGERSWVVETYSSKPYYAKLLAWTVKCIIHSRGWKIMSVQGCNYDEPVIRDIQIDYTKFESCVIDGQILVEKDDIRMVITVKTCRGGTNFVQIEAREKHQGLVKHSLTPSQIS